MIKYGHLHPPAYDLDLVTAKVALFWGQNDWLGDPTVSHTHFPFSLNVTLF
jgi:hypothetical protein